MKALRATGLSQASLRNEVAYLKRCFQLGVEREWLTVNPCSLIRFKTTPMAELKRKLEDVVLSDGEIERLLGAARTPYSIEKAIVRRGKKVNLKWTETPPAYLSVFLHCAIVTGGRLGELLGAVLKTSAGLRWLIRFCGWKKARGMARGTRKRPPEKS